MLSIVFFLVKYKMAQSIKIDTPYALKVVCIILIALSPFLPYQTFTFLDNIVFKIACLFLILGVCFYDFQLALLLTITFMIFILNVNHALLVNTKTRENFQQQPVVVGKRDQIPDIEDPIPNERPVPVREVSPVLVEEPVNFVCPSEHRSDMNEDLMTYYIDNKIKPYEVFIKMMTNDDALRAAQGDF